MITSFQLSSQCSCGYSAVVSICFCYASGVLINVLEMSSDMKSANFQKAIPTGDSEQARTLVYSNIHLKMAARRPLTTNQLNPNEALCFPRLIQ
mmetsp:Transcript_23459/g.32813  ORF Transcript_23459/g.32813 Transcript_23459/m.32813 type:complete len:94 (-) Transcript_23459:688-969(-)